MTGDDSTHTDARDAAPFTSDANSRERSEPLDYRLELGAWGLWVHVSRGGDIGTSGGDVQVEYPGGHAGGYLHVGDPQRTSEVVAGFTGLVAALVTALLGFTFVEAVMVVVGLVGLSGALIHRLFREHGQRITVADSEGRE